MIKPCDISHGDEAHNRLVGSVRDKMGSEQGLLELSEIFKALGDHTRVRMLRALSFEELPVCCLASILDMSPSAVSHQLRVLRQARLVSHRRQGKNVFYRLDDRHVEILVRVGLAHALERPAPDPENAPGD